MNYEEIKAAKIAQYAAHETASKMFCDEADKAASFDDASDAEYIAHKNRLSEYHSKMGEASEALRRLDRKEQVLILGVESANDLHADA